MRVLGISCDYHDAAAALVDDGTIVAACEEERFTRAKHDHALPLRAMLACAAIAGIELDDVDVVVFHEKPLLAASRIVAAAQRVGPRAVPSFVRTFPAVTRQNLMIRHRIEEVFRREGAKVPQIRYGEHHLSHAAAAFLPSAFPSAAILTLDGLGEWATASLGRGSTHHVELLAEMRFPDSLGLLYSLVTAWCGFEPNDGEYKLMGLAPYGEPTYVDALRRIATVEDDGSLRVSARTVHWWKGDPRRSRRLAQLFGGPPRRPDEPLSRREVDLARSIQEITEAALLQAAAHVADRTGERNLVLAGGVALNCVATGRLLREGPFDDVWVQPAAGDAGSALGAALWYWHDQLGNPRPDTAALPGGDAMAGAALGPSFSADEVRRWLASEGIEATHLPDLGERCDHVARRLAEGAVVGWFDGRMEFGPRALGHRSILADPRGADVKDRLNRQIKGRESFRPFAPAVLAERAAEWFEIDRPSPYMTFTHRVAADRLVDPGPEPDDLSARSSLPRSQIPACTHVDGSARVQTVDADVHPAFHRLLQAFEAQTGCPVLVNTSFNRAGEPIVCTPADAHATAVATGMDLLVVGDAVIDLRRTAGASDG